MSNIFIIGGGHSLLNCNPAKFKNVKTIVINKSLFFILKADYFITMDYSFLRKINTVKRKFDKSTATKFFVANFDNDYIIEKNGQIINSKPNKEVVWDLNQFDIIIKSRKMAGISTTWKGFRTGFNSGYCGLQLALLLGYKNIYLYGIDLNIDRITHFHGGYRQNVRTFQERLEQYYEYFKIGLEECKRLYPNVNIYSTSKKSRLNALLKYKEI